MRQPNLGKVWWVPSTLAPLPSEQLPPGENQHDIFTAAINRVDPAFAADALHHAASGR